MATWSDVQSILSAFPQTVRTPGDGDPVFRIRGRFFLRYRVAENVIAVQTGRDLRVTLLGQGDPPFYTTPLYEAERGGVVLVRLDAIEGDRLREVVTDAWLATAPQRVVTAWRDGGTEEAVDVPDAPPE